MRTILTALCIIAAAAAHGDTKITLLADVTADRAEVVIGPQSNRLDEAHAHTARKDNPHGITPNQIGALTNEQDLAALRTYHYGSPDIVESPADWFEFDASTGTITGFNYAPGREYVVIPWEIGGVSVVKLDGFMSGGDNEVVSVIAPKSVAVVNGSLQNCHSLTSVSLPNATTVNNSLWYCTSLTSVSLPNATTVSESLSGCSALTSVSLPNATTVNGGLLSCSSLTSVSLPNATTVNNSLQNCHSLTSVSLPNATTVNASLYYCSALTNVTFSGSPPAINEYTFYDSPNVTVYVTNPQATGWGATFGGRPVVRPNLYADNLYQGGERVATENYVDQRIAAMPEPTPYLPQLNAATNLVVRLVASNDWIMAIGEIQ